MSPAPTATLPPDLSKLNVSQLKAICKERRIVGYSKLGKAALICKLSEVVVQKNPPCSVSTQKTASNTENGSQFSFCETDLVPADDNPRAGSDPSSQSYIGPPRS